MSSNLTDIDHRTPRLFIDHPLTPAGEVPLDRDQSHYLTTVLRLKSGDPIKIFNGIDERTYDVPALTAGKTYVYICTVHPNMLGTITLQ